MWQFSYNQIRLENVAINDALPLKADRRDVIGKLKSFRGFESEHVRWTGNRTEY